MRALQVVVRTRVEPKTFFANERTFLAWLSIAVLLMFTALALLDTGGSRMVTSSAVGASPVPGPNSGASSTGCSGFSSVLQCKASQVRMFISTFTGNPDGHR